MVLKIYISGMSGNKEVKKRQQRVFMILDSKNIKYELIDITEPGKENEKEMMQAKSTGSGGTVSDPEPRYPLPPQIFNEEEYCGDYEAFDLANEIDTLEQFLKLASADTTAVSTAQIELKQVEENGVENKGAAAVADDIQEGENKENEEQQKSSDKTAPTEEVDGGGSAVEEVALKEENVRETDASNIAASNNAAEVNNNNNDNDEKHQREQNNTEMKDVDDDVKTEEIDKPAEIMKDAKEEDILQLTTKEVTTE